MDQQLINKLRKDTPGCKHVLHFNNAGAALMPTPVINALQSHLNLEVQIGGYEAAEQVSDQIESFYSLAARLINSHAEEIAFMDNGTHAWAIAFHSLLLKRGDRVLTCISEYASNYLTLLQQAKKCGIIIEVIKNDKYGQVDIDDLKQKLNKDVKLIAITHVPTQGGLINPIVEVGKIAREMNIPYLLDAIQSVGQLPIDVETIGCDFLCATGRKYLRGPRGTGFLYVRRKMLKDCEPMFIDLHSATWTAMNSYQLRTDARCFETWEQNIAAKIGLAKAIEYALDLSMPVIWLRIKYLANLLRQQLSDIPGLTLQDLGENQCGLVTFNLENLSAPALKKQLAQLNMNVTISLQEYARLDLESRNIKELIRASVHYYNTEEEIGYLCAALRRLAGNPK
ncbi:selenocysteine lyase, PLP-dependent [Legionella busanensis]|uniref:Selenocysteine lyase, PLP-dependent n=1 Tax=Legionella busanensis TaxID=190655 RepID=A0A378JJG2_9GAMM|nr:aminotransferase class V-fold PLP-dependent enzyme [Legionella busanensis]STX50891.1 selenocysteine lyase, PLP-dependent [Legionella busanensis]